MEGRCRCNACQNKKGPRSQSGGTKREKLSINADGDDGKSQPSSNHRESLKILVEDRKPLPKPIDKENMPTFPSRGEASPSFKAIVAEV